MHSRTRIRALLADVIAEESLTEREADRLVDSVIAELTDIAEPVWDYDEDGYDYDE